MNASRTPLIYGISAALAVALALAGYAALPQKPDASDPVASREVVEYTVLAPAEEGGEPVVKYAYAGDPLPQKLAPDEEVSLRTETSYTRRVGTAKEGREEKPLYQGTFYARPVYVKQGGEWYYRETATTTESAFRAGHKESVLATLFATVAEAASFSGFSTTGDGEWRAIANGNIEDGSANFTHCRNGIGVDGSDVTSLDTTSVTITIQSRYNSGSTGACTIRRAYLTFDTSSVPSGSTVTASTLQVYVTAKATNVNDGSDTLTVTKPGATWTTWTEAAGSNTIDISSSITTSAYNTFTLNSTGYNWLVLGGTTVLGLQEGHDLAASMTTNATGNTVTLSTAEETGTTQDPTLSITYTPGSKGFWMFQDF